MDLGLTDKVALVSGASRGIGNRIALALAAEGAKLCISGRTQETLKAAADQVAACGVEVETFTGDMTNTDEAAGFVAAAKERFGGCDILINNVGGSVWTPFTEISDDEWMHVFNLSFFSAVKVARAAMPLMEQRGGGSIVNISSIFGRETGGPISYNAAKAAMIAMTSSLAQEAAKKNIRVNSIAPGSIIFPGGSWERRQNEDPEGIQAFVDAHIAFGRFGNPEEVAAVVAFMASDKASWVTGTCLNVDGGQSRSII
jgi:3-oxoacyl-[acyl-carrier protein] reductase